MRDKREVQTPMAVGALSVPLGCRGSHLARGAHARRLAPAVVQTGLEAEAGPVEPAPPGDEAETRHRAGASESVQRDSKQIP